MSILKDEIYYQTATHLAKKIQNKELSVSEVMEVHLDRIHEVNPKVNAIVSLDEEKAMEAARLADEKIAALNENIGSLFGLPIAIKDTHNAKGFPTTKGSPIFKNQLAETDEIIVERLKAAGAIVIGKTNVPEFAAGSHTFNPVFGATKNPYDLTKSAGGSSGGAAAALATGMIPIADGSDMGGSCRNPAAYNNVVGLRPSPGRIPVHSKRSLYSPLAVQGPLARTVSDLALILSVVTGFSEKAPLSSELSPRLFEHSLKSETKNLKIAFSTDLNGSFPVDPSVRAAFKKQLKVFTDLGCELEEASPDFKHAKEIFQTFRAYGFALSNEELYKSNKEQLKETVIWNIEKGLNLTGEDLRRADHYRTDLYEETRKFFGKYDFLVLPVSQVQPFNVDIEYPATIDGLAMKNYVEWMESCSHITVTGCPAISIPAGFCENNLPFGLQIVAPFNEDFRLLQIAYAFEQATMYNQIRPNLS